MKKVTLIPGDGVGEEITDVALKVIEASGAKIEWEKHYAGESAFSIFNNPLPMETVESIRRNKVALKGPLTTPIATGYRSVNVTLRQIFDLYACIRPCKSFDGLKTKNLDIVIIRENTEDLYVGIEFEKGSTDLVKILNRKIGDDVAVSLKLISEKASRKIAEFAFNYSVKNNRKKVTVVTKANILKATDGLFLEVARDVSKKYPNIEYDEKLVDNMCMQLVLKPEIYDVLLLPNLYGDIISDLCAGLVGGLGVVASANIGDEYAIFEPVHGSAPKYKNQNKVNPIAMILAGAMMLEHIGETQPAEKIRNAVREVIKEGRRLTYDLGGSATTTDVGDEIISKLRG